MSHKFRQLVVWQRAMTLVTDIYKQTHDFPSEERFGLTSRLRRAATSIPLNIAEGSGSDSPAEFARFLQIALGSAYEVMTALELAERLNYRDRTQIAALLSELDSIAAMLTGLIKHFRADTKRLRETTAQYTEGGVQAAVLSDYRLQTTDDRLMLREATIDEAETVAEVLRAAFEEYRGWLDPPSGAHGETAEKIRNDMCEARIVLALLGDTIAGCVFYAPVNEHVDLFRLAVLPDYRQRGIGRALIAYVEERALALGFQRVQLGVRLQLPRNRALYERLGYHFVEARTHQGYAEPTYAILEKVLVTANHTSIPPLDDRR